MFSVNIAERTQSAGDVTWQRNLISIRGLSRLFMFFISFHVMASLGQQMPLYQYRKWAIRAYCRRLSAKIATWRGGVFNRGYWAESHLWGSGQHLPDHA